MRGKWRGSSAPRRPESGRAGGRRGRLAENWRAVAAPGSEAEGSKEAGSLRSSRLIVMEFGRWNWRKDWHLSGPWNIEYIIVIIIDNICTTIPQNIFCLIIWKCDWYTYTVIRYTTFSAHHNKILVMKVIKRNNPTKWSENFLVYS